jgi:N-acetylneuraminic acid mutarotase
MRATALFFGIIAFGGCAAGDTAAPPDAAAPAAPEPQLAVASNSWTAKARMPVPFKDFSAAVMSNSLGQPLIYVLGGGTDESSQNIQVITYNTVTNIWTSRYLAGEDPNGHGGLRATRPNGIGRIGDVLYMTGGFDTYWVGLNNGMALNVGTGAYRPSTNTFSVVAYPAYSVLPPSADGVTGVINGKMYVLVGTAPLDPSKCDLVSCPLGTFRCFARFDPVTKVWTTRKPAPHYHRSGAGGVINGKFYVVGGYDSKGNVTRNLDVYDPATDSWTTRALLPKPGIGLKGTVLHGKLFVISTQAAYLYNPATDTWAQRASPPPNSAAQAVGASAVTVTLNGLQRVYVVGGQDASGAAVPTSVYTP